MVADGGHEDGVHEILPVQEEWSSHFHALGLQLLHDGLADLARIRVEVTATGFVEELYRLGKLVVLGEQAGVVGLLNGREEWRGWLMDDLSVPVSDGQRSAAERERGAERRETAQDVAVRNFDPCRWESNLPTDVRHG